MKLQSDITEYLSATNAQQSIHAEIGTDETKARAMRPQRWAAMTRRREAAENLIMSVLGEFRSSLDNAGLVEFYESMAAGKEMPETVFKIADATAKHYGKIFLRTPLPSHGVGMNLPNRVGRATSNVNQHVTPPDAAEKGLF